MKPNWTTKWPDKPGEYWFYGKRFADAVHVTPDELHFVTARNTATPNTVVLIGAGHFWYKEECGKGMWTPVELPELPT